MLFSFIDMYTEIHVIMYHEDTMQSSATCQNARKP